MINIIDYIMAARRTVVFLMLIVISIGLLTYINIAKDAEPDIDIPFIYIGVAYAATSEQQYGPNKIDASALQQANYLELEIPIINNSLNLKQVCANYI